MLEQLMNYTVEKIKKYSDKNKEGLFWQYSQQLNDPNDGLIEIKAPRGYQRKKRLGRRIRAATIEFYKKQGFNLTGTFDNNKARELHFERKINFLEKYLVSIERQGIFFYIHVSHN